jgi:molecular chaperone HtpG
MVASEKGPDRQLERLLAGAGRLTAAAKPVLEINHVMIGGIARGIGR